MGQVLHRSATTTEAIRRALQARQESVGAAAERDGISRLPDVNGDKPKRPKSDGYPSGYFHIDFAQVGMEQGKLRLFVTIDGASKFAFVQRHETVSLLPAFPIWSRPDPARSKLC